uniref:Low-density lipoprotein receptor-related protein 1-like n=1 Tax=Saccoglossus kowalevskii TaxID=10224 RepID=A0ABM0MJS2_SACKO|nr:PREDICTED: low-density lipoprotein receptor-related protein 1-like [Saccoglossus kowalevskii]
MASETWHTSRLVCVFLHILTSIATQPLKSPSLIWTEYYDDEQSSSIRFVEGGPQSIHPTSLLANDTTILFSEERSQKVGLNFDVELSLIFWVDALRGEVSKMNISIEGAVTETIYKDTSSILKDVSVDWASRNIYWTDSGNRWIAISDYNGNYYNPIITDIRNPNCIVVNPVARYIYWSNIGDMPIIERAKLNGKDRETIVDGEKKHIKEIRGLTIDYNNNKLYWVDSSSQILWSSQLDGRSVLALHISDNYVSTVDLDIDQEFFMLCNYDPGRITLVKRSTPGEHSDIYTADTYLTSMVYLDQSRQKKLSSSCQQNNGGCDHLCLNEAGDSTCICGIGFTVSADGYTCNEWIEQTTVVTEPISMLSTHIETVANTTVIPIIYPIHMIAIIVTKTKSRRLPQNRPLPPSPVELKEDDTHIYEDLYGNGINIHDIRPPQTEVVVNVSPSEPPLVHYQPLSGVNVQGLGSTGDTDGDEDNDEGEDNDEYEHMDPITFAEGDQVPEDISDPVKQAELDHEGYLTPVNPDDSQNNDPNAVDEPAQYDHSSEDDNTNIPDDMSNISYEYMRGISGEQADAEVPLLCDSDDENKEDDGDIKDRYIVLDDDEDNSADESDTYQPGENAYTINQDNCDAEVFYFLE